MTSAIRVEQRGRGINWGSSPWQEIRMWPASTTPEECRRSERGLHGGGSTPRSRIFAAIATAREARELGAALREGKPLTFRMPCSPPWTGAESAPGFAVSGPAPQFAGGDSQP